jgi:electron transport complex protein RnfC
VQYFRQEKAEIYAISMEENAPRKPKHAFEARQARLEREKAPVRNAISRPPFSLPRKIRMRLTPPWPGFAKKADAAQPVVIQAGEKPDNSEAIAAREARKAAARARQAEKAQTVQADTEVDPRKAAVEAAIARAKARKAGERGEQEAVDPRKAAVEAAIARAKARKAQQQRGGSRSRSTRAKPPSKPRSPAPKRAKRRSRRQPQNQKHRSTRVKPPSKRRSPAPKPVKQRSRKSSRRPPMTTRAKPPSPPPLRAFRRRKPHSKQLTRIKWFSESQVPLTPTTSARHRAL